MTNTTPANFPWYAKATSRAGYGGAWHKNAWRSGGAWSFYFYYFTFRHTLPGASLRG